MADIIEIKARSGFTPFAVLTDLREGFARRPLWTAFAWDEIQQRYRRSRLGLAWIVFSFVFFVGSISMFFGGFAQIDSVAFTMHVATSYGIFTFLIGNITDGCAVFKVSTSWIKSSDLPHSIYVYKSIARSLFVFSINLVITIVIALVSGYTFTPLALLAIPAFLLLLANAIWVQLVLGYCTARFRDLEHLVTAVTRIIFFVTPILWVLEERSGFTRILAELNPFTHALEISAGPILGRDPSPRSWAIVLGLTVFGYIAALIVGGLARRRLAYWL
ncbi:MAG: ABC transporter permease [Pseudomonadota bacterium]